MQQTLGLIYFVGQEDNKPKDNQRNLFVMISKALHALVLSGNCAVEDCAKHGDMELLPVKFSPVYSVNFSQLFTEMNSVLPSNSHRIVKDS